ncbi:MAG: hypothetical protein WAN11_13120 [Syntrophobacteraceae bacterium]
MLFGTCFSDMEKTKTGQALRFFLLVYIIVLAYPFYISPLSTGLDPSWVFALNHLVDSNLFFGKDVIFTCGPLGFLNWPQPIGSNPSIALICHLSVWFLFAALLFFGVIKRLFSLDQLFMFAIVMIPFGRLNFDYFIGFLILLLLCFSLYLRNWLPCFLLAILLTPALFFMKFTSGLFALPAVLALSFFQLFTDRNRGILQLVLSLILIPLLFTGAYLLYNPSFTDMLAYLRGSFELSSEYSVAMSMSVPGRWYEIYFAFIFAIAYLFVSIRLYRSGQPSFWLSLAFLPSLFLAFKHGFVRQDVHVTIFFVAALFITALLLLFSDLRKAKMKEMNYIFPILVIICFFVYQQHQHSFLLDRIFPVASIKRIIKTFDLETQGKAFQLEKEKLPKDFLAEIGRSKVGIFPSEISYVAANNLDYSPLPVIQSYCALTSCLDKLNADFLSGAKAPPYLLMGFESVDGRNCLIDVPSTWLSIYKWYEPCLTSESVLLLRKKEAPRFKRLEAAGAAEYPKTESVRLPDFEGPLLVKISVDLTLTGKLVKTLYKILPVEMALTDDAGRVSVFRVVPDTLKNGMFLNYLPMDLHETGLLLNGTAARKICCFELLGDGLKMYRDKMSVQFVKVPGVIINHPFKDLSFPEGIQRSPKKTQFCIASINQRHAKKNMTKIIIASERLIRIQGWAVDDQEEDAGESVWVDIDGKSYPAARCPSPDVATRFNKPAYENAGFTFNIFVSSLSPGAHHFSLKLLAKNGTYYYQTNPLVLEIPNK